MELDAGQVAVVTGGASGIGLGLARALGARGLKIVIADIATTGCKRLPNNSVRTGPK